MKARLFLPCAAAAVLGLFASPALASDPFGTYARVDKVTYSPDKANATIVQIDGVFALSKGGSTYAPPAPGYMYFQCKAGDEAMCRLQWADIESVIGTKSCAGFGQLSVPPGTVRAKGTTPASPDTYELGTGVQKTPFALGVCDGLQNYKEIPPADAGVDAAAPVVPDSGASSSSSSSSSSSGGTSGAAPTPTSTSPAPKSSGGCHAAPVPFASAGLLAAASLVALGAGRRLSRRRR